jgi:hypothetical protein
VLDTKTGEEVASLAGKFQPAVFAAHAHALGKWYHDAAILVERNNHGHAVLEALNQRGQLRLLSGHDDKTGWLSSQLGKVILYDRCADAIRNREALGLRQRVSRGGTTLVPQKPGFTAHAVAIRPSPLRPIFRSQRGRQQQRQGGGSEERLGCAEHLFSLFYHGRVW